jgi:hypothetical protein
METVEITKCQLCGKTGENMTTYGIRHKEHGWIEVCSDCWKEGLENNNFVAGSGGKGNACSGCCGCKSC